MAWNEPGGGGKDQDPWSNPRRSGKPPNIDEAINRLQKKFGGAMGGAGGAKGIAVVGALLVGVWLLSGIYTIDAGQRGIELQFGKYTDTTTAGPHWHLPYPIGSVIKVNVDEFRDKQLKMSALTNDENIVEVRIGSQFVIADPVKYLFNVRDPDGTLSDVMQSAIREVIGSKKMDNVLTDGRTEIASLVRDRMQEMLNGYDTGLKVQSVNLQDVQPPEAVQPAFEDAIRAREDEQRYISEASAYSNKIIPQARGEAAQIDEQAKGYESKITNLALGEASRFTQLLKSYQMAPDLTRERMYLDTVAGVLAKNKSVVIDSGQSSNVFYLPLGGDQRAAPAAKTPLDPLSLPLPATPSLSDAAGARGSVTSDNRSDLRTRNAP
ncbi:MAG: HflK protein [Halothiobacillus sp. 24-54-40]|jgi:membrane protease subunit HflK|nr:FtsH protease activity modulator HflK [Halothiobacillaceae bacterium]OYY44279.1 MAG: HflK protein [Halothiobacillus sp. 35-54-62]OYY56544.1 MAG: HflK protein [Halothiobacillus sp. 28-55-5]OYZ88395.1 MAG: HflK protein [Halothiobacillus sp. 24-54-40]OZA81703.1 MAG: HflK protein [Halothiobacillus sp. 39-53-45]HQS01804.1 FtsH protease activity modulator HflK [Halothiobacillus sp.]